MATRRRRQLDTNSNSTHEHKSLNSKVIFIKTHTENYLQAWNDLLPGRIFSLSFSCHTRTRIFLLLPLEMEKKTFFSASVLFQLIFTEKCLNFHAAEFSQFSFTIQLFFGHFRQTKIDEERKIFCFYLHNWALKHRSPTRAPSGLFLFVSRTFELKLKSCVEKCFASVDCGNLWKFRACAFRLLLVF